MAYKKTCPTCELYFICQQGYKKMPPNEEGCEDWELAFRIYQEVTDTEAKKHLKGS